MLHVRLAQAFQSRLADALGKPKEPCLHVRRKGGDFSHDGFVEDFNSPSHVSLYLNFEIDGRGEKARCLVQFDPRAFRNVASTMSAARTLGGWLPVDMIASIFEKASTCRRRNGESLRISRKAGASFSGVQSSWMNSGTTFSPMTRLAKITELVRIARRMSSSTPGRKLPICSIRGWPT